MSGFRSEEKGEEEGEEEQGEQEEEEKEEQEGRGQCSIRVFGEIYDDF